MEASPQEMAVTLQKGTADRRTIYHCPWRAMKNLHVLDFSDLQHPHSYYVKLKPACDIWLGWKTLEDARRFADAAFWLHTQAE